MLISLLQCTMYWNKCLRLQWVTLGLADDDCMGDQDAPLPVLLKRSSGKCLQVSSSTTGGPYLRVMAGRTDFCSVLGRSKQRVQGQSEQYDRLESACSLVMLAGNVEDRSTYQKSPALILDPHKTNAATGSQQIDKCKRKKEAKMRSQTKPSP